jgi:hypothetical protein
MGHIISNQINIPAGNPCVVEIDLVGTFNFTDAPSGTISADAASYSNATVSINNSSLNANLTLGAITDVTGSDEIDSIDVISSASIGT